LRDEGEDDESARTVARSAFELLEVIDALRDGATGELSVRAAAGDGAAIGVAFVERGDVCWIAARGQARRLSDLLRARTRPELGASAMEQVFLRCRREGLRLGEHLVAAGLLDADALREALLRHSVESLERLGDLATRVSFTPRGTGGYEPRYTFRTGELAEALGARTHVDEAASLRTALDACEPSWGAAFARSGAHAGPIPVARVGPAVNARALARVGRWAAGALDLGGAFDGALQLSTFVDANKGGILLWSEGDATCVACFGDQARFSRAASRRAATRGRT
jgi:hypothetical protein